MDKNKKETTKPSFAVCAEEADVIFQGCPCDNPDGCAGYEMASQCVGCLNNPHK